MLSFTARPSHLLALACAGIALAIAASGCAPVELKGIKADPTFTYAEILSGGMGIGGVLDSTKQPPANVSLEWTDLLASRIGASLKAVNVLSHGTLVLRGGEPLMSRAVAKYALKTPDPIAFQELTLLPVRYLIFARIRRDTVQTDRFEDRFDPGTLIVQGLLGLFQTPKQRKEEDKKDIVALVSEVTRKVSMEVKVLDLRSQRFVWEVTINKKESNRSTVTYDANSDDPEPDYPPYPLAPGMRGVLDSIFTAAAVNLPGPMVR